MLSGYEGWYERLCYPDFWLCPVFDGRSSKRANARRIRSSYFVRCCKSVCNRALTNMSVDCYTWAVKSEISKFLPSTSNWSIEKICRDLQPPGFQYVCLYCSNPHEILPFAICFKFSIMWVKYFRSNDANEDVLQDIRETLEAQKQGNFEIKARTRSGIVCYSLYFFIIGPSIGKLNYIYIGPSIRTIEEW